MKMMFTNLGSGPAMIAVFVVLCTKVPSSNGLINMTYESNNNRSGKWILETTVDRDVFYSVNIDINQYVKLRPKKEFLLLNLSIDREPGYGNVLFSTENGYEALKSGCHAIFEQPDSNAACEDFKKTNYNTCSSINTTTNNTRIRFFGIFDKPLNPIVIEYNTITCKSEIRSQPTTKLLSTTLVTTSTESIVTITDINKNVSNETGDGNKKKSGGFPLPLLIVIVVVSSIIILCGLLVLVCHRLRKSKGPNGINMGAQNEHYIHFDEESANREERHGDEGYEAIVHRQNILQNERRESSQLTRAKSTGCLVENKERKSNEVIYDVVASNNLSDGEYTEMKSHSLPSKKRLATCYSCDDISYSNIKESWECLEEARMNKNRKQEAKKKFSASEVGKITEFPSTSQSAYPVVDYYNIETLAPNKEKENIENDSEYCNIVKYTAVTKPKKKRQDQDVAISSNQVVDYCNIEQANNEMNNNDGYLEPIKLDLIDTATYIELQ
uniref:uncharacterized protein LOC120340612 n=1 Tax=Styela clava TaxID=7725 RepID=UPI00193A6952|nr:uncharacterized protein LOC120340612 [Styela clava]